MKYHNVQIVAHNYCLKWEMDNGKLLQVHPLYLMVFTLKNLRNNILLLINFFLIFQNFIR